MFEVMAAENKSLRQKRKVSQHRYSVVKLQTRAAMRPSDLFRTYRESCLLTPQEVSFTLNGHFSEKIWGIRCKFFVNFHFDFLSLSLYNGQIFAKWSGIRIVKFSWTTFSFITFNAISSILPNLQLLPHEKCFLPSFWQSHQNISLLYNGHFRAGLSTNSAKLFFLSQYNVHFFRKFRGIKCKFSVNSRLQINHNNQVPYTPPHPKRTNFHRMTICRFVNFLWMKICPSYYNVHFFFKTQVSDQKSFLISH